ncbi:hypothetical protein GA0111570_10199 [Raineyella antarctica]|uniref:Sap, sulfolipid-1-addressing protein n=1 Tax=Raineyella antarctica TaxID=1577474 RepID=A0A1G6GCY4_9ACTN|nr:hypothetical protein [Raineyella antarctica]SDB79830.1 hypothetical protein GA0111570_10199 [Raineyella antarctica]
MTSWQVLGACVAMAIAGFDPFGALVLLGAVARGTSRRAAVAFTVASAAVIVAAAVALDLLAYAVLPHGLPHVPSIVWGSLEAAAALGLLAWGLRRLLSRRNDGHQAPTDPDAEGASRRRRGTGTGAMTVAGAAYGLTVLGDPGFWGLVALVHRLQAGPALGIAALWWLLSQSPLVALAIAIAFGAGEPVGRWMRRSWSRIAGPLGRVGTAAILLGGLVLAADVVLWLVTGSFLIR